jgi:AraC family transcriptional regulator, regulatory protein of adaptative response / DNA-3-methyladenine glycosylase II
MSSAIASHRLPRPRALVDLADTQGLYRVLTARDSRFDGQFFVGVTSTKIYCRPICRVRVPLQKNCRFYAHAAQAEQAGFRPCLRCRPELAPHYLSVGHGPALALHTMRAIQRGELIHGNFVRLAQSLGVTDRHLRRVFQSYSGVSPVQYLQTSRLLLAKQLLCDSNLSMTEIAFASGFQSLRRFNASFVEHYRLQPGALREAGRAVSMSQPAGFGRFPLQVRLAFGAPFDAVALFRFLELRAIAGIETVSVSARKASYQRSLRVGDALGEIEVVWRAGRQYLELRVGESLASHMVLIMRLTRQVFDLDASSGSIDDDLGELAAARPGLRLPGAFDPFEIAIRAVLGQQITVAAARTLARRLVERFGQTLQERSNQTGESSGRQMFFPQAADIACLDVSQLAQLGMPARRAETLVNVARWFASSPDGHRARSDFAALLADLLALKGVGPWTASYILMRGWSHPDVFLPGDVVLRKVTGQSSDKLMMLHAERWAPWRSYAVIHLWAQAPLLKS